MRVARSTWAMAAFLGVALGLLVPILPLALVGLLFLGIAVAIVVFRMPELGLVIALLSGRFDSLPILKDLEGPFYVALFAIGLTGVVSLIKKPRFGPSVLGGIKYIIPVVMFGFVSALSLFYSISSNYGAEKVVEYLVYTFPTVILVLVLLDDREAYWRLVYSMLAVTLALALAAFGASALQGSISGGRLAALGGGPNIFGRFMALGAISALTLGFRGRRYIGWAVALVGMYSIATYLSGSRQAILGLVLSLAIYAFTVWWGSTWKEKKRLVIVGILLCMIMPVLYRVALPAGLESTTGYQRLLLLFQQDKGDSVNARVRMAQDALAVFVQSPIGGIGIGGYALATGGTDQRLYPHNIVLETAAELGVIGLSSLVWLLCHAFVNVIKLCSWLATRSEPRTDSALVAFAVSCFAFSLLVAQVSGDLYDNRLIWVFGAVVVGLRSVLSKDQPAIDSRPSVQV